MIDTPDLKSKYTIIDMPRLEGTVTEIEIFCLHHGKQTIKTNIPYEEFNFLHIVCSKCQVEAGAVPDVKADVCPLCGSFNIVPHCMSCNSFNWDKPLN